jgi:hypothetical protein
VLMPKGVPAELSRYVGRGTVYIAWDPDDLAYWGYWDGSPDGPNDALQQCPKSASAWEVIEWGRARAPRIWIRPRHDDDTYYWAGAGDPPEELREHPRYEPDH